MSKICQITGLQQEVLLGRRELLDQTEDQCCRSPYD